jgi:hypothetical protein
MKKLILLCLVIAALGAGMYLIYQRNAKQAAKSTTTGINLSALGMSMPGMSMGGDSSKRYTVSFTTSPVVVEPNQDTQLKFKIYDAASGNEVSAYSVIMEKLMHLVIVDSELVYFTHIHPVQNGAEFTITTKFPKADTYHLYINFQPQGATEQQVGFALAVGGGALGQAQAVAVDTSLTKTFGPYTATLSTLDGSAFSAQAMSNSAQIINFHLQDTKTGQGISDLNPYLGALGHLVMINEQTYHYIHIHPLISFDSGDRGPDVRFLPAALFDKIDPGVYRVFGQFNHNNQIFVTDFTIKLN